MNASSSPARCKRCGTPILTSFVLSMYNGYCGPCGRHLEYERETRIEAKRRDVNPYKGITDPVEILKIMHRPVVRDELVNLIPYPRTADELYAELTPSQARAMAAHANTLLQQHQRAEARDIVRCLGGMTKLQLDPPLDELASDLRQAMANMKWLEQYGEAICYSVVYLHERVKVISTSFNRGGFKIVMDVTQVASPGLEWGLVETRPERVNWSFRWDDGATKNRPWQLGLWYGSAGMSLFFHPEFVKAALSIAGTFATEPTPEKVYMALAGFRDAYGHDAGAYMAELQAHQDAGKLQDLITRHLERGRTCQTWKLNSRQMEELVRARNQRTT